MKPHVVLLILQGTFLAKIGAYNMCGSDEVCRPIDECHFENSLALLEQFSLLKFCGVFFEDTEHCCKKEQFEPNKTVGPPSDIVGGNNINSINSERCGTSGVNRIKGGETAKIEQFPWIALLQYHSNDDEKVLSFNCGGGLITNRYVLTAAHCQSTNNMILFSVRLGEHTISTTKDCQFVNDREYCTFPAEDYAIEDFVPHENYNTLSKLNDIALIRLSRGVALSMEKRHIKTICLPVEDFQRLDYDGLDKSEENPDGNKLTVAGWGRYDESDKGSDQLAFAYVDYQPNSDCSAQFDALKKRQDGLFKFIKSDIHDTQLCAGGGVVADVCKGDSGSPLIGIAVLKKDDPVDRAFLHGIVSYGMPCRVKEQIPGVYTRVSSFIGWIKKTMKP